MYKLIIVDDEPLVIKAISHIIDNNFNNVYISATTGNGTEAVKLARRDKPDIIFIDIKLNGLNGLDSIKEIIKFLPETIIIIISAYDDFNFARKAIQLGVMDYLLKPVNKTDIINIIIKSLNYLNELMIDNQEQILSGEILLTDSSPPYAFQPPWELERRLFKAIENGEIQQVLLELETLFINFDENINLAGKKKYFQELIAVIFRLFYLYIPQDRDITISLHQFQSGLNSIFTERDLLQYLTKILGSLLQTISPLLFRIDSNPLLNMAKKYIEAHYYKDITLDNISSHVAISPGYLCKLFKENYNITIIDYLTRVRINKSIQLLKETDLHIKTISKKVGYRDSNYFSKVFKKVMGKTPTEYRE